MVICCVHGAGGAPRQAQVHPRGQELGGGSAWRAQRTPPQLCLRPRRNSPRELAVARRARAPCARWRRSCRRPRGTPRRRRGGLPGAPRCRRARRARTAAVDPPVLLTDAGPGDGVMLGVVVGEGQGCGLPSLCLSPSLSHSPSFRLSLSLLPSITLPPALYLSLHSSISLSLLPSLCLSLSQHTRTHRLEYNATRQAECDIVPPA